MIRRRVLGLVLFCIGLGMLLVLTLPIGTIFIAIIMTAAGLYLVTRKC